jgi:hypothetical protein
MLSTIFSKCTIPWVVLQITTSSAFAHLENQVIIYGNSHRYVKTHITCEYPDRDETYTAELYPEEFTAAYLPDEVSKFCVVNVFGLDSATEENLDLTIYLCNSFELPHEDSK